METQTTRAEIVNTADEIAMALGAMSGRMRRRAEYMGIADQTMRTFGFTPGCVNEGELFANILPGRFFGAAPELYRDHCAELCARQKGGRDLAPGTRAEVILFLMWASFEEPLRVGPSALYVWLVRRALPELARHAGIHDDPTPMYQGQFEQDLEAARAELAGKRWEL